MRSGSYHKKRDAGKIEEEREKVDDATHGFGVDRDPIHHPGTPTSIKSRPNLLVSLGRSQIPQTPIYIGGDTSITIASMQ